MRAQVLAFSLLAATTAFADHHESAQHQEAFEAPDIVQAHEFLPTNLQSGPNHTVSSEATSDGFQNTYTINSKFGAFEATGLVGVKQRITEVDALAYLEAVSRAEVFGAALRDAGIETAGAIAKVFTAPVKTVQGIPGGIGRVFEGAKRGFGITKRIFTRKSKESGIEPEDFRELNYLMGNSQREWAGELKTDPYTTNMKLRETISRMSVVEFVGGLPVDIALPMGSGLAVGVLGDETEIYRQSAKQLEATNRACLKTLGVKKRAINKFIEADYLTPTNQTATCNALAKLAGIDGSTDLVAALAASDSFETTDFLIQLANLMAWYQTDLQGNAPITSIVIDDGLPYAMTGNQALIMMPAENLSWTEVLANRLEALSDNKGSVWVLGSPTKQTLENLKSHGWQVVTTRTNGDLHELYHKTI